MVYSLSLQISVWHVLLAAAVQAALFLLFLLLLCVWLRHRHSALSAQILALRRDISNSSSHVTQTGNHVTNHVGRSGLLLANHIAGSVSRNELTCTTHDSQHVTAQPMSGLLSNQSLSDQDSWQVADGRRRRKKLKDKSL